MFGRMGYVLKVNWCLTKLNIMPSHINKDWRQGMQDAGYSSGATAQETALAIASNLPMSLNFSLKEETILDWLIKGMIDPKKIDVQSSLYKMNGLLDKIVNLYNQIYSEELEIDYSKIVP